MHARELRTAKEEVRYGFALAVSILAWIVLVISIVGLFYAALIIPAVLIGHALFLAHIRHNGVRIGPDQMPTLWRRVDGAAKKLGLERTPDTYVIQAGGLLNAFATRLFARNFVIIYADLIDACEASNPSLDGPDDADAPATELDFVIAHELGHIACGHLSWVLLPARAVPLLGPAYSRACEYTCDICGDAVIDDPETSERALAILASGGRLARHINLPAFAAQRETAGKFWSAVYELNASHPYLCKRVAALRERHRPGAAPERGRNRLTYPLAPLFSIFTGGAAGASMAAVMAIGIMVAVAVPAFRQYLDRAKALQTAAVDQNDQVQEPAAPESSVDANGFLAGAAYPWHIKLPAPSWQPLALAEAKRTNPLADGWLVRRDLDAHVVIIAEPVESGHALSEFIPTIIENAEKAGTDYQLLEQTPIAVPGGEGVILHSKCTLSGLNLEYWTAVRLEGGYLFQVVGFSEIKNFPKVRDQIAAAVDSFELVKIQAEAESEAEAPVQ